ncbi:hypothetical protein BTO06_14070 [Tenacibaculum sp. SZ-18]|nr:hypothetical protein BTO06_14070 [Tenacibaculum sp. SZ-18]
MEKPYFFLELNYNFVKKFNSGVTFALVLESKQYSYTKTYNMSFFNFLLGRKKSNETYESVAIDNDLLQKKQRLIKFNQVLTDYADKVYQRWSYSKTEEERGKLIKVSFGLNRFLHELNDELRNRNYSEGTIKECEDIEKQLQALF